jgi:hypothetical protein
VILQILLWDNLPPGESYNEEGDGMIFTKFVLILVIDIQLLMKIYNFTNEVCKNEGDILLSVRILLELLNISKKIVALVVD